MLTLSVNFSKIKSLSESEIIKLLNNLTHYDIVENFDALIASVPPKLLVERLRPEDYALNGVARKLVESCGVAPEEILKHFSDDDLNKLSIQDKAALTTDQTAERLVSSLDDSIDHFVGSYLYYLNKSGKKLPPDLLDKKIQDLARHNDEFERESRLNWFLGYLLDTGYKPDSILDLSSWNNAPFSAAECRLLLKYGATPKKLVKKLSSDSLKLILYGDLKARGFEISEKEVATLIKTYIHRPINRPAEDAIPMFLENGVSPQLIADEARYIGQYSSFYALVNAGASPESMYDKLSLSILEKNYQDLEPYVDFGQLIHSRVKNRIDHPASGFDIFLAERAKWLVEHGVNQNIVVKGIGKVSNLGRYLDDLFECLDPAHLRELMASRLAWGQTYDIFPPLVRHLPLITEHEIVSKRDLHQLAEEWINKLFKRSGMWRTWTCSYADINFLLENLDTIVTIDPYFSVQRQVVDMLISTDLRNLLTNHLDTLVRQDIYSKGLVKELVKDPGYCPEITFSTIKLILEQGFTASWFIENAHYRFFSPDRNISQEEIRYYIEHGADPDQVACVYLRSRQKDLPSAQELDKLIGQPTVWSKML